MRPLSPGGGHWIGNQMVLLSGDRKGEQVCPGVGKRKNGTGEQRRGYGQIEIGHQGVR